MSKFVEGRAQPPSIQSLVYFQSLFKILRVDARISGAVDLGSFERRGVCWLFSWSRGRTPRRRDGPGPRVRRLVGCFDVEPESSSLDASSPTTRRLQPASDLSGELSECESLRDLRFGEELESESEDFERLRDLRFGDGDGEPCLPALNRRVQGQCRAVAP